MPEITQEIRIAEALLFAAAEPLSEEFLAERLPEGCDVAQVLEDIRTLYEGRGVNLARAAGKWFLRTAEDLSSYLSIERKVHRKPSNAAVETLAIIAYHQPVTRSEVEEIRGVSVGKGSFDVLLEAGWIRPIGRRRTPGRPTTWGTTPAFLQELGLDSIADLPGVEELKAAGLLDTRPASAVVAGDSGLMPESPASNDFANDANADAADAGGKHAGLAASGNGSAGEPGRNGNGSSDPGDYGSEDDAGLPITGIGIEPPFELQQLADAPGDPAPVS